MTLPQLNPRTHHELQPGHPLSKPLGQWISGSRRSCARVSGPRTRPDRKVSHDSPHGRNRPGFPATLRFHFQECVGVAKYSMANRKPMSDMILNWPSTLPTRSPSWQSGKVLPHRLPPPIGAMGVQNSHCFSMNSTHSAISHGWRKGVANRENV